MPDRGNTAGFFRLLALVLAAALLLSLLPMLYAARYDLPDSDDLLFGAQMPVEPGASLGDWLAGGARTAALHYQVNHGRYAASFFGALLMGLLGTAHYWVTPFLTLGLFLACTLYFSRVLLVRLLRVKAWVWLALSTLMLLCQLQFLPSPAEGFYWLIGAMVYAIPYGLTLLLFGLLLSLYLDGSKKGVPLNGLLALVLTPVLAGLSQTVMLPAAGLLLGYVLLAVVKKRRDCLLWGGLTLALYIAGSIIQLTAPGVAVRAAWEAEFYGVTHTPNAIKAVLFSFPYAAGCLLHRLDGSMLAFIILTALGLAPALQKTACRFRLPLLVTALSFCLFATLLTPNLYAQGYIGPNRQRNILYFMEFWFWGVNVAYWTGWGIRKVESGSALPALAASWNAGQGMVRKGRLAILCLCLLLLAAGAFVRDVNTTSSVAALREIAGGSARARYETRLAEIAAGLGDDPGERTPSRIYFY